MDPVLYAIGLMIICASVLAIFARRFNQPLIFGYVLAGVLLGPAVSGIISDPGPIVWLSELALVFLMFVIGMQLDLSRFKEVGKVSIVIGTLQVTLVAATGIAAGLFFGLTMIQSIYLGLVAAFSSTILVVKLLDETRETASLVGELAVGILIIQDILAVAALALLGAFTDGVLATEIPTVGLLVESFNLQHLHPTLLTGITVFVNGFLFILVAYLFFKYVAPQIFKRVLGNNELLFITSLAIVFFHLCSIRVLPLFCGNRFLRSRNGAFFCSL